MIQSMTGYVDKKFDYKTFSLRISIKSLNHKYLDWNCRGNKIREVEDRLRGICQKELYRGRIEVYLQIDFLDSSHWELRINEELFSKIIRSVQRVSSRLKEKVSFSVDNLFSIPNVAELRRKDLSRNELNFLEESFKRTLADLIEVRRKEGKELKREIQKHIKEAREAVRKLEKLAKKQPSLIRQKIEVKLREMGEQIVPSEEKLIEETAFILQRYDLSEEIERTKSHMAYLQALLSPREKSPAGKKLDFVAQELLREANTINSKAQDIDIIKQSLVIKSEVESIRQQVQNLE